MRILMKQAYTQVQRPKHLVAVCVVGVLLALLYPTNLRTYHDPSANGAPSWVVFADRYLRFANTAAQVALPILLQDKIGMVQLVYVGISTTVATQGLKHLLNRRGVWGTRLGERPRSLNSNNNMPSGHSSMASCAAYFVCRRYGWVHALYVIPVLLLAMYARVALNAHTVAAVIAGALVGLLMAAIFTSNRARAPQ